MIEDRQFAHKVAFVNVKNSVLPGGNPQVLISYETETGDGFIPHELVLIGKKGQSLRVTLDRGSGVLQ